MNFAEQNCLKTMLLFLNIFVFYAYFIQPVSWFRQPIECTESMEISTISPSSNYSYIISQHLLDFVRESEKSYAAYITKRDASITARGGIDKIKPWTDPIFWSYFAPSISCPFASLVRVGNLGDGGKWICGLNEIARKSYSSPCIIYSFGVGGDSSFEKELLSSTNCSVWAFDPTVNGINLDVSKFPGRVHFEKIGLGPKSSSGSSPGIKSLQEIMAQLGHSWIDILKVDIETAEFSAFDQIVQDYPTGLPFTHLNVEVHLKSFKGSKTEAESDTKQFSDFWIWWSKLEKVGLRGFTSEGNDLFNIIAGESKPLLMEYSFLNIRPLLNVINA